MDNSSGKVIQLKPKKADPNKCERRIAPGRKSASNHKNVKRIAQFSAVGLAIALRYLLFFVLKALRGPVRVCCALFTFAAIVGLPLAFFGYDAGHPNRTMAFAVLGVGLIAAQAISWFYDSLLLRLSPEPMYLP